MKIRVFKYLVLIITFLTLCVFQSKAQLIVNAGLDKRVCSNQTTLLGGSPSASGGTAPYVYSWSPATGLSSTSDANPTLNANVYGTYILRVTDANDVIGIDTIVLTLDPISQINAGVDLEMCIGQQIAIGPNAASLPSGATYSWSPGATLNDSTLSNPVSNATFTTTYTLTVSGGSCLAHRDSMVLNVKPLPIVDAGADISIYSGQQAVLMGSGADSYYWTPEDDLKFNNTPNPNVTPIVSTTYSLVATKNGCTAYDTVRVTVIPSDTLIFYNLISPNQDESNEMWYIVNVEKYPNNELTLFNRWGKEVYHAKPFKNGVFNGTVFGEKLPSATYYYIFDPGNGTEKKKGSLTIVR